MHLSINSISCNKSLELTCRIVPRLALAVRHAGLRASSQNGSHQAPARQGRQSPNWALGHAACCLAWVPSQQQSKSALSAPVRMAHLPRSLLVFHYCCSFSCCQDADHQKTRSRLHDGCRCHGLEHTKQQRSQVDRQCSNRAESVELYTLSQWCLGESQILITRRQCHVAGVLSNLCPVPVGADSQGCNSLYLHDGPVLHALTQHTAFRSVRRLLPHGRLL